MGCGPVAVDLWPYGGIKLEYSVSEELYPRKEPMLEQFLKSCSLRVGPALEQFMKDCILWVEIHSGAGEEHE